MPDKSFSTFHVILIKGVLFRSILISLPRPDPTPSASALIKLPFSLDPSVQLVSPLTFLTFKVLNSSLVKSKTLTFSANKGFVIKSKHPNNIKKNFIKLRVYLN